MSSETTFGSVNCGKSIWLQSQMAVRKRKRSLSVVPSRMASFTEGKAAMTEPTPADQHPTPAALAERIAKFLAGLERAGRQPNRRESYHLREALEMIESERYNDAEAAVIKAEHAAPLPAHAASLVQTNELGAVEHLRAALGQILEEGK